MIENIYIPAKLPGLVEMIFEHKQDTPANWKILPSGTVDLLFRVGPQPVIDYAKKMDEHDSPMRQFCFLSGLHTDAVDLSFEKFHMIGISMSPIAVYALFGVQANDIKDYYLDGDMVIEQLEKIQDKLNADISFIDKAMWMENELLSKVNETADLHTAIRIKKLTDQIVGKIQHNPHQRIEDFMGYSRTQTYRLFNSWFGVSSHSYQRLVQFVESINKMHQLPQDTSLTEIGLQSGYFDQSHFIRSFKEFSGITPGEYYKHKSEIPAQMSF